MTVEEQLLGEVMRLKAELAKFEPYRPYLSQIQYLEQVQADLQAWYQKLIQQKDGLAANQRELDAQQQQQQWRAARLKNEKAQLDTQHKQQQARTGEQQRKQDELDTQQQQQQQRGKQLQQQGAELTQKYNRLVARREQLSRLGSIVAAIRRTERAQVARAASMPYAAIELQPATLSHPSQQPRPSGRAALGQQALAQQRRLSDPTYRADALASIRQLYYEQSQTLADQAYVAGALLEPGQLPLLRELLTSTDQRNLLGARLRGAGQVEPLLKIAAESDPVRRMEQLTEFANGVLKISPPPDPPPDDQIDRPLIDAVRRIDVAMVARALASGENADMAQAVARAGELVRLPLRRLLRSHDSQVAEFARQALKLIVISPGASHHHHPADLDGKPPAGLAAPPELPDDTAALEQMLRRAGATPAVMGRSFAHAPHMQPLILALIAEEVDV